MKRIKVLVVLVCALAMVLSGCGGERVVAENPYYAVVKKADGYYINFKPGLEEKVEGYDPRLFVTSAVELRDIRTMRDGLLNATMESGLILHLKMLIAFDEDSAKICDLNNLYEPVLPQSSADAGAWRKGRAAAAQSTPKHPPRRSRFPCRNSSAARCRVSCRVC